MHLSQEIVYVRETLEAKATQVKHAKGNDPYDVIKKSDSEAGGVAYQSYYFKDQDVESQHPLVEQAPDR